MSYRIKAPAKINLSLDVVSKREDGYHNLESIMHTVPLCDILEFTPDSSENLAIKCNKPDMCTDEKNIVYKAYRAFYRELGTSPDGFTVYIEKNIPDAAGLAGGSSDGAQTLKFLNEYKNNPFSEDELLKIGASVGADIPFLIKGGCCLCEGIGEILTPVPELPKCRIIIAKPETKVLSTPEIFASLKLDSIRKHPETNNLIKALNEQSLVRIASGMYNVLEEVSREKCNEIIKIEELLIRNGAINAIMSGSGSSVFGLFPPDSDTKEAIKELQSFDSELFIFETGL